MNVLQTISKARAGLVLDQPFFGALALKLRIVEDPDCETAWTDGQALGFNPDFIKSLSLEEVKGLIAHEVMHCVCQHHTRREGRDPVKWNIAGDYIVNDILIDAGFTLPAQPLIDAQYKGMYTEQAFDLLPDPPKDRQDPGGIGEVRDGKGKDGKAAQPADMQKIEQDWKVATVQAAQAAKVCGNLPGNIARLVGDVVDPKVNWKTVLRDFVEKSARNDYNWKRPNRRYFWQGIYLPSLYSEELDHVVIAVDTSISISDRELKQFTSEISSILEEYRTEIDVVYCDTRIAGHHHLSSDDLPLKLEPKGGGGTDFRPPFKWVDEQGLTPACLIYLTDMECYHFPKPAPDYPVLWVSTQRGRGSNPPFGELIEM